VTAHPVSPARTADSHSPSLTVGLDLVSGRLTVIGPLSRDTIHRFRDAIATLLVCDCPLWTVDVTELTACDRAGEHALVGACRWAARQGRRVALVGTPPWLQRKLNRFRPGHRRVHNGPVTLADADPVTTGADLKRHPAPSRGDPGASDDRDQPAEMSAQVPLFTATVVGKKGTIGIRGHLDRVGADLLCGSVVALQRLGRQHIGIRQAPGATVDGEARVVLAALARRLSAEGVQLEIL
jgi:ABC-type transporter Mla MlaB component